MNHFPRVFLTRRKINDGSEYLGPFTSVAKVRELMDFIKANNSTAHLQTKSDSQQILRKKNLRFVLNITWAIAKDHVKDCRHPKIMMKD